MTAKARPSEIVHSKIYGKTRPERVDLGYRAGVVRVMNSRTSEGGVGAARENARYLHVKDLQAKAQTEGRELGGHTPVRFTYYPLCCPFDSNCRASK